MAGVTDDSVPELGMWLAKLSSLRPEARTGEMTAVATAVLAELYARAPEGARAYYRKAVALAEVGKPTPFLPWGAFVGGPPPAVALLWRPDEDPEAAGYAVFEAWNVETFLAALGPGGFLVSLVVAPSAKAQVADVFKRAASAGAAAGDALAVVGEAAADAGKAAADAAGDVLGAVKWLAIGGATYAAYKLFLKKGK